MKKSLRFGVVVFPGSNCDRDCYHVVAKVLKKPVEFIWHQDTKLDHFDCLILPGGFSYGDYLRCGAIARFSPIMKQVVKFANDGGLVIGICNGFQILLESGLLPGAMRRNTNLHFICKYVDIRVENADNPFTDVCKKGQVLRIPIAHNEGNYYIDKAGLAKLKKNNQIIFRYSSSQGVVDKKFNPNGALDNIAGISNEAGNVLGLMPHPERCSEKELGSSDGFLLFHSAVNYLEANR